MNFCAIECVLYVSLLPLVSKIYIYLCAVCVCTNSNIFSYFLPQRLMWIINVVHQITLSKTKLQRSLSHYFGKNKHQRIQYSESLGVSNQTISLPVAFKGGQDVDSCFPSSDEPRLLNKIRMSTLLRSPEIGLHRE